MEPVSPPAFSESKERKVIFLLCILAAIHVFIYSAAFPFFNNVDEPLHFDLTVKYSHVHIPRALEPLSPESAQFLAFYTSMAYMGKPDFFPHHQFPPPPWTQPMETVRQNLLVNEVAWQRQINYESSQPPLYYAICGAYWELGKMCGFHDGFQLYGLRFLNILFVTLLVWLGYRAARLIFPENPFLRLGVPALLAVMPPSAFYSIESDVLSPLCFGATFICLLKLLRMEIPSARLAMATGLALAATFLTKMTSLPLLLVAIAAVTFKIRSLAVAGKLRSALPTMILLTVPPVLVAGCWMAWIKYNFGDFTGADAKTEHLGWTHKPFGEWWPHPIFTPTGFWTFVSNLMASFWQGEFVWHGEPLASPVVDMIYVISSIGFIGLALANLFARRSAASPFQRHALGFGFCSFAAAVVFFIFLSVIYDYHGDFPSREHPYFTSGRLLLGTLIPFMLIFVYGIDCALEKFGGRTKNLALAAIVLFMLISEVIADWPVFPNEYNWFHM